MSEPKGLFVWQDLTVENADQVRDFYLAVLGWEAAPVDMGDYSDYNISPAGSSEVAAGICHAKGVNAKVPPQWILYALVDDLEEAIAKAVANGGTIVDDRREAGMDMAIVLDPAGAAFGLFKAS